MNYKETLKLARQQNINAFDLIVATELADAIDMFEVKLNDSQFELACDVIRNAYFRAEEAVTFWCLARAYCELKTGHQPTTPRRIIDCASGY